MQQSSGSGKKRSSWRNAFAALVALSVLIPAGVLSMTSLPASSVPSASGVTGALATPPLAHTKLVKTDTLKLTSLAELMELSPEERAEVDIARANLLVAKATSGGEEIDVDQTLTVLDQWAQQAAEETDRLILQFYTNPGEYNHSEGYYHILSFITVLQQDCGIRYNPARINEPDFTNPGDLFIRGMIGAELRTYSHVGSVGVQVTAIPFSDEAPTKLPGVRTLPPKEPGVSRRVLPLITTI